MLSGGGPLGIGWGAGLVAGAAAGADGGNPTAVEEIAPDEGIDASSAGPMTPNRPRPWYARQQEAAEKRHERLVEQCRESRRPQAAGADVADMARKLGISRRTVYRYKDLVEPPKGPIRPFLPKRWIVERTFAWLVQDRRKSKDYKRLLESAEAFIYVAMSRLMARRLARS